MSPELKPPPTQAKTMPLWQRDALWVLACALAVSFLVAVLSPGNFWRGWTAAFLLAALVLTGLFIAWRCGGGGRGLLLLMSLAFVLRLGGGLALSQAYKAWGYEKDVYQLGYLFPDAMRRDVESYYVGISGDALLFNPELRFGTDQYGGLGLLSAAVYRALSPDEHRPYLMLILAAGFFTLGLPFLQKAAHLVWGEKTALLAAWVYVLYPDGIFFTAAQMREPFIIGLSAVALWGAVSWRRHLPRSILASGLALLAILPISPPSAAFLAIILLLLVWLDFTAAHQGRMWKILGLAGIAGGGLALVAITWNFFREAAGWDAALAEASSGMLASIIDQLGDRLRLPFITLYGLAQPVLPAAIFEPSIPLMKTVGLLRSLGWYALLPLLVYAVLAALRWTKPGIERLQTLWLALIPWFWLGISSIRAGGDMSDNPRYRLILLVVLSISAAWAWLQSREHRDPWFGRILIIEGLFLVFFTQWYAARYVHFLVKLPFMTMLALIAACTALVIAGGLIYDAWKRKRG